MNRCCQPRSHSARISVAQRSVSMFRSLSQRRGPPTRELIIAAVPLENVVVIAALQLIVAVPRVLVIVASAAQKRVGRSGKRCA